MLSIDLEPLLKARGIHKAHAFLMNAGFTRHTASHILNGESKSFRLDHIELLCNALNCEPNDLLLFSPDKNVHYRENSPLYKLSAESRQTNLNALADIPFKDLKNLTNELLSKKDI